MSKRIDKKIGEANRVGERAFIGYIWDNCEVLAIAASEHADRKARIYLHNVLTDKEKKIVFGEQIAK